MHMMNEKINKYVWLSFAVAALLLAYAGINYADAYSKSIQPSSFRSFSVSAEGKAVAVPDVAQFSFSVFTQGGKTIATIVKENTDKMNQAITYVKQSGVDDKDVKTEQYSLTPRYQYSSCPRDGGICPPATIIGYDVRQTVQVKVRNFEKVGDILAGVVQNGANEVSGLQFTLDDPTSVQDEARTEAIAKAKVKALAVAKAGGFTLGRLLNINEGFNVPRPYYGDSMMKLSSVGMGAAEVAPSIAPGSEETTINVVLQYEIK